MIKLLPQSGVCADRMPMLILVVMRKSQLGLSLGWVCAVTLSSLMVTVPFTKKLKSLQLALMKIGATASSSQKKTGTLPSDLNENVPVFFFLQIYRKISGMCKWKIFCALIFFIKKKVA